MYCNNCGTQNADGVRFCSNCGAALQSSFQETTVLQQPQPQAQPFAPVTPEPQKQKNNKKLIAIIGGAVGVIAIIAIVLVIVFAGKGKDDKPADYPNESKPAVSDVQNSDKQVEPSKPAPTPEKSALSRDETAMAFMKAFANFDFAEADKYCILDLSEVYKTIAQMNGENISEIYTVINEVLLDELPEFGEEDTEINSMQDYYSVIGRLCKDEIQNYDPDALVELQKYDPEIVGTEKIDLNDSTSREYLIDDIVGCDPFGLVNETNYSKFINLDDITEAYEIEIADKNGDIDDSDSFYIVKYKGEWKVVANAVSPYVDDNF